MHRLGSRFQGRWAAAVVAVALVAAAAVHRGGAAAAAASLPPPAAVAEDSPELIGFGELEEEWRGEVVHLSWEPRVFLYKRFLSATECEHIKGLAQPRLVSSDVVDSSTGEFTASKSRTSTGTFLDPSQDAVVAAIEKRVAQVSMTPQENQENMQVLRYVDGQQYEPHYDYFHDDLNKAPEVGGQRLATALMYLTTPLEGGETVFPLAETQTPREGLSACVRRGLANVPEAGDLLLFYALRPDGTEDTKSLHGSCPTLKGEKWSATIWMHTGRYQERDQMGAVVERPLPPVGPCYDDNESCAEWAFFGECEKNPAYMLEECRQSCNVCSPDENKVPQPPANLPGGGAAAQET